MSNIYTASSKSYILLYGCRQLDGPTAVSMDTGLAGLGAKAPASKLDDLDSALGFGPASVPKVQINWLLCFLFLKLVY